MKTELLNKLIRYAHIAEFAYNPDYEKGDRYKIDGVTYTIISRIWNKKTSIEGYILKRDDEPGKYVVTFAGTKQMRDILIDVKFLKVRWPKEWSKSGGIISKLKVHRGFLKQYKSIRVKLHKEILEILMANNFKANIVVCGHSLGGANTGIAGLDLFQCFSSPSINFESYKYNSPAEFNAKGAAIFNHRMNNAHRIVFDKCPVSRVPKIGYKQDSDLYRIVGKKFTNKPHKSWIPLWNTSHHGIKRVIKGLLKVKGNI